jgi:RNA polymerase sigma-70 factor (ECF subfamily)
MLYGARKVRRPTRHADSSPRTFESVYRENFEYVFRAAMRMGGSEVDPEDIAQEVFVVVARRLNTFDGSSQITTWLYGITLNVARGMRNRLRTRRRLDLDQIVPESSTDVDYVELRQAHQLAHEILVAMPEKKREVILLFEFEELSGEEIASILNVNLKTVWTRLHYARKEFSQRLARRIDRRTPRSIRNRVPIRSELLFDPAIAE